VVVNVARSGIIFSMGYTTYDFEETMERAAGEGVSVENVRTVIAAWGEGGDDWNEWSGGFLLEMKDRSLVYITGWCDTSGWGCQDGIEVFKFVDNADLVEQYENIDTLRDAHEWDMEPADLNLYLERENFDDPYAEEEYDMDDYDEGAPDDEELTVEDDSLFIRSLIDNRDKL
jgi:hypothetical protein